MNISNIEITNLTSQILNPFVRFTIGGTYYIETITLDQGKKTYVHHGTPGTQRITDLVSYLEPSKCKSFKQSLTSDVKLSYNQLRAEHLHIEVWDKAKWSLNTFVGYESLPLIDIASGPIKHNLKISDKTEKFGSSTQQVCELSLQVNFEEIWDFKLALNDFRASDIGYRGDDP
jgi:hypothetical protein